ncbi:hypothetical protein BGX28_010491 [Mortierella sp. GBA30]|nr:hypothetical protein BGX28_010491 [Mortierella sp. GBA30]
MMHVTCAQREDLVTKGKYFELFCENHKDEGALRRIMESQSRKSAFSSSSSSLSSKSSLPSRATKRGSKSYRESSASGSEDDDEDGDEDDDDLDHEDEGSDSEDEEIVRVEEDDDDERRGRNSRSVQQRGYTKNSNSKLSNDATQRRKKQRSSDSEEEIDVDDTEAVLGSGGGGSGASASFGQQSRGKVAKTSAQDSAAEAQRRRLLQRMDKTKKKQSTGGLDKVINLSALPIRTLGGVGPAAPAPSILGSNPSGGVGGAELKQKLPGISRYNNNSGSNSNINSSNSSYAGLDSPSPSLSSSDRFSNNGFMQSNGRGSIDSHGKNTKGLTFELDPGIDAASLKSSRSLSASAAPSPIIPNFSNTGSPNQGRPGERPYPSPRMGYGATVEETREMQSTIQALQQKVATLESTIQNRALQQHGHHHNRNTTPPSGSSSSSSTPSMSTSTATLANPYAVGPPGQDLQHKFNVLQHSHAEEKMRNLTLRQNLKDLFGFLQVPVPGVSTVAEGVQGENSLNNGGRIDWTTERIDDYVQALRDAVVGAENASTVRLDTKRRDVIVDRVMKEIGL